MSAPGTDQPELALDLSSVMTLLSATSSVAVIAGAPSRRALFEFRANFEGRSFPRVRR